jgi:hypothetical protein
MIHVARMNKMHRNRHRDPSPSITGPSRRYVRRDGMSAVAGRPNSLALPDLIAAQDGKCVATQMLDQFVSATQTPDYSIVDMIDSQVSYSCGGQLFRSAQFYSYMPR